MSQRLPESDSSAPPFVISGPSRPGLPVLLAVPHGGRAYPASLVAALRQPDAAILRLEDRRVDELALIAAQSTGIRMVAARTPRALIDLNRDPADIDWSMTAGAGTLQQPLAGHRWPSGLGLIPRRVPGMGELWRSPLLPAEIDRRIAQVHVPYHAALETELAALQARFGIALLIDVHSMPPLPVPAVGKAAQLVVGDRLGASCAALLADHALAIATQSGWQTAHNKPYAGGYVLARHGQPRRGIHALQLEICRSRYLDEALAEPGDGFDSAAALLAEIIARLGEAAMQMAARPADADGWLQAAE